MRQRKKWNHSVGKRPNRVTVFERKPGGTLYYRVWDPSLSAGEGNFRRKSFGHRDKDRARGFAAELHAKLVRGEEDRRANRITLVRLLALYREHQTPKKGAAEQKADARRIGMFTRHFGPDKDPSRITRAEWERFVELRGSGELRADGKRVEDSKKRRPVRDRAIEADLRFLSSVLRWGTLWQDREGQYLLRENPVRGYPVPREKNPRRPVQTQDRYEVLLAVAGQVMYETINTETAEDGKCRRKRVKVPSYLHELLVLANETGRRISSILGLTYEDLDLERRASAPHGSITWRADIDKKRVEWKDIPMTAQARAAIDQVLRERPGIGAAPLFPSPKDRTQPVSRYLADKWLRQAEKLAGLEPQKGGLWHPFRRKAATELKHAPDKDVQALLGWRDLRSLKQCYQHADPATMTAALESRRELREVAL